MSRVSPRTGRREFLQLAGALLAGGCSPRRPEAYELTPNPTGEQARLDPATGANARHANPPLPIEHVILIVKENRTYDAIFGDFPEGEPDEHGETPRCHEAMHGEPVEHGREKALKPESHVHCHEDQRLVAVYHELARSFTLCARFFSEVRGPSFPNHLMLLAGEAPAHDDPSGPPNTWVCPQYCFDYRTFADQFAAAGKTWRSYDETDFVSSFSMIRHLNDSPNIVPFARFEADARAGTLPSLSYVFSDREESEHPPESLCVGQAWTLRQIRAVAEGPLWEKSVIFVVWDDWGGFHDHIRPPVVERDHLGRPLRYGYRVPCLVVSPYAKKSYISVKPHSHLSVLRFAEDVYGLPPLNSRVAASSGMEDCFDFTQAPRRATLPGDPSCKAK